MNETLNGFFYICLPESTLALVKELAAKTQRDDGSPATIGDVIAEALQDYAIKHSN